MHLLDITVNGGWFSFGIIAIIIAAIALLVKIDELKKSVNDATISRIKTEGIIKEKDIFIEKMQSDIKVKAQDLGVKFFEEWKQSELTKYIKVIEESGAAKSKALLNQWLIENEERIRKDAANRSVRNVLGKVTEHLIPFSEAMKNFNPKDIRFIGSPIDLVVFDGAEELKRDELTIHFIEVKTGTSALSKRQQMIRDAIQFGRVKWQRVDMKSFGDEVNAALSQ